MVLVFLIKRVNNSLKLSQRQVLTIWNICQTNNESILLNTNQGILRFSFINHRLNTVLEGNFKQSYIDKSQKLWVAAIDGYISVYDLSNSDLFLHKSNALQGSLWQFHESQTDPSVMWVATSKGLLKINKQTYATTLISEKDGLPNQYIYAILEDKHGYLWCSTNKGLVRYHPDLKTIKHYTTRDGLINTEYNPNSALWASKGEMWFGGNNGVDAFHPDSIRDIGEAPQLAITGLKIYDKYWRGDTSIIVVHGVTLKYYENTLTFELAAMEYTDPENNKYKVMLEGYDRDWSNLGTQNFVTYVNLPAADYVFKFKACNSEGIWNETPRVLQVTIHPPFWRRWWFITLCLLATMALVGYIVYLRLSKIIDLQEVRIKLYENLHDDLGSRLMAIVLMVDMALQKKNKQTPSVSEASEVENLNMTLSETKDIASNIVGNMRRLVWATDPENDELRNVVQQMKTDAHILLPPLVDFNILIAELLLKLKVDGNKRYQMLSIVDEALNNIAKYAEATAVTVTIEREGDNLCQIISDNGKGFDPEKPREDKPNSSGRGLVNMLRRAKRIKGTLHIESVLGKGTTITLTFPLTAATFLQRLRPFFRVPSPK